MDFLDDTALVPLGPGRFEAAINRRWWIVLGPNGGLLAALLLRAAQATVTRADLVPRTMTIQYLAAPVEGPVTLAATVERELEQGAKRRQDPLLVPRRAPDTQGAVALGQRVGEDERPLLGSPERGLVPTAAVVERDEPAGKLGAGLDRLEIRLGNVVPPEEARPEGARPVAPDLIEPERGRGG